MLITLTTDFGLDDPFVAMMKGVILSRCPHTRLIDICHTIPPQDILAASRILTESAPYFPGATIHVAVVDPGVGTSRRIICVEANGQLFLAPDNGLLTPFFDNARRAFWLTNEHLFLKPLSTTFHGRDVFAPVAAALASGLDPHELGPILPMSDLVCLKLPEPTQNHQQLQGQCIRADHFGNMATNISKKDLDTFLDHGDTPMITLGDTIITGISPTYGPKRAEVIALINSSDHLEISIPGDHAERALNIAIGAPVLVRKTPCTD